MSLFTSLYSGRSGLDANSTSLSVIGDNIANSNTIGFKSSRAAFAEALAQNLGGGAGESQRGLGTRLQAIQRILNQGAVLNTGQATDLAIEGKGMFMVRGASAGADGVYYTRAGQFSVDNEGMLVNLDGMRVQGYLADVIGDLSNRIGDLNIGGQSSPPLATSRFGMEANLNATDDAINFEDPNNPGTFFTDFNIDFPEDTSNFSTGITVYDSLGAAHHIQVNFSKTDDGQWSWNATTDTGNIQAGTGMGTSADGTRTLIAQGTLTFDTDGKLDTQTMTASDFHPQGATAPQSIEFDFGDDIASGGTGLGGLTQFDGTSAIRSQQQNGYPPGELAAVVVEADGTVVGAFTNGTSRPLGQVVLAGFEAPDKLERVGGNLFRQTRGSGEAAIGGANSGGRGTIIGGALEQSNVDLAGEFIQMITAQRSYQANTRIITTTDQLLQETMMIKR